MASFVIITVTLVWVATFLDAFLTQEYQPLIYVSPPMGMVIGYITGVRIVRRLNGARNGA